MRINLLGLNDYEDMAVFATTKMPVYHKTKLKVVSGLAAVCFCYNSICVTTGMAICVCYSSRDDRFCLSQQHG